MLSFNKWDSHKDIRSRHQLTLGHDLHSAFVSNLKFMILLLHSLVLNKIPCARRLKEPGRFMSFSKK